MQACAQARQSSGLKGKTMKRPHVDVAVTDIPQSIGFYSAFFAAQPGVVKTDGTGENIARIAHEKQSACGRPQTAPAKTAPACC
jgi:hypothetical protein